MCTCTGSLRGLQDRSFGKCPLRQQRGRILTPCTHSSLLDELYCESRSALRKVDGPAARGTQGPAVKQAPPSPPITQLSPQEAKNPTRLPFEPMYQQLAVWQAQHCSCHVPRNCFDAPPLLDAWVRHLRRKYASGRLEQWKVDRLNLLGFEWSMGDVEAKWVNMYHQLRRFKAVHGHTHVPQDYRNSAEPGWEILARWLRRQAQLLAKAKLSQQQQEMLSRVGVVLEVPAHQVEQYTQLQGLNAHERKKLRRSWREERRRSSSVVQQPQQQHIQHKPGCSSSAQPQQPQQQEQQQRRHSGSKRQKQQQPPQQQQQQEQQQRRGSSGVLQPQQHPQQQQQQQHLHHQNSQHAWQQQRRLRSSSTMQLQQQRPRGSIDVRPQQLQQQEHLQQQNYQHTWGQQQRRRSSGVVQPEQQQQQQEQHVQQQTYQRARRQQQQKHHVQLQNHQHSQQQQQQPQQQQPSEELPSPKHRSRRRLPLYPRKASAAVHAVQLSTPSQFSSSRTDKRPRPPSTDSSSQAKPLVYHQQTPSAPTASLSP